MPVMLSRDNIDVQKYKNLETHKAVYLRNTTEHPNAVLIQAITYSLQTMTMPTGTKIWYKKIHSQTPKGMTGGANGSARLVYIRLQPPEFFTNYRFPALLKVQDDYLIRVNTFFEALLYYTAHELRHVYQFYSLSPEIYKSLRRSEDDAHTEASRILTLYKTGQKYDTFRSSTPGKT